MNTISSRFSYRVQYSDDAREAEERQAAEILCLDESLTVQNAPDADINQLMRRFGITDGSRLPTSLGQIDPSYYGNFDQQPMTLADASEQLRVVDERFMELPANIRAKFDNDPRTLYNWVMDEKNEEEAITLGLLSRRDSQGNPIATATSQTVGTPPAGDKTTPST